MKDLLSKRLGQGGLGFALLMGVGSMVYLKHVESEIAREAARTESPSVVKQWNEKNAAHKQAPSPSVCCERGDAICCQSADFSNSTSEQSAKADNPPAVDTPITDPIEGPAPPLSEGLVVPEHIVQEANHLREWDGKQKAHHKAWATHNERETQLYDDFQRRYTALLMTLPIEERQALFNQMRHQIESVSPDIWKAYATKLYDYGLDFETEYSPKESEVRAKQINAHMAALSEQLLEAAKESQKFLYISKELMEESEDF